MPTLHLYELKCIVSEDWSFDQDEPRIKVNGRTIDDLVVMEGVTYAVDKDVAFKSEARVTLVERDGGVDGEDFLGEHVVSKGSGIMKFTKDGADYELRYAVS